MIFLNGQSGSDLRLSVAREMKLDAFWQERYELACRPLYELAPPAATAAPRAVAWAVGAGFAPEVDTVAAVLDGDGVFAEEYFLKLLAVLGLPPLTAA